MDDIVQRLQAKADQYRWDYGDDKRSIYDDATDEIMRLRGGAVGANVGADRAAIIEECARVIEQQQETISETSHGTRRHVTPRRAGNLSGLAYADAIRALASVGAKVGADETSRPETQSS